MNVLLTDIKLNAAPAAEEISNTKSSSKIDVAKDASNEDFWLMMQKTLNADSGNNPLLTESTKIKKPASDLMVDADVSTDLTFVTQTGNESAISEDLITNEATINGLGENLPTNGNFLPFLVDPKGSAVTEKDNELKSFGNSLPFLVEQKGPVLPEKHNGLKSLPQSSQVDRVVHTITEGLNSRGVISNSAQLESNAPFLDSDEFDSLTAKTFELSALQHSASDSSSTRLQAAMAAMNGLQTASANPSNANPISTSVLPSNLDKMVMTNPDSSAEWGSALGDRVSVMLNQKQHLATIRLDPPTLGKMDIQILVKDDVTNVTIHTQHAQTRDMVDSASYRLREILQDAGYQNVNVDVSHQSDQQKQDAQFSNSSDANDGLDSDAASSADKLPMTVQINLPDSLVDFFA